jgi:hypothetical protein
MLAFKNGRVLKLCAKTLHFSKGNQRPEKITMDDKNKIN